MGIWAGAAAAILPAGCRYAPPEEGGVWVNDIHSMLNRTRVLRIERPASVASLQEVVLAAAREGRAVSIMAARHAMGGQQFGSDTVLVDTTGLAGIHDFDPETGQVEVGAGTLWPELISGLLDMQAGRDEQWGIVQKQTGADRLSIGGALAANAHGRGLIYRPMVQDVEAFTLISADGETRRCSRVENEELFRLAIGGYGLFGPIASVRLRLAPRRKIERVVEVADVADLAGRFAERIEEGFLFGDFQFSTEVGTANLLRKGVFSCYRPVDPGTPVPEAQQKLSRDNWIDLIALSHTDRGEAFRRYSSYYLTTNGQIYWSDTHQLSTYIDDYHALLGGRIGSQSQGSEMITEIYVPRAALAAFLDTVRADFTENQVDLIYGTIRLIERDDESVLAWAREPWACVIFNLHTARDEAALRLTADHFRRLIDRGREHGGCYFLTYHRWATREQVLACHPRFLEFLALKSKYDPEKRFQSDWYRHYSRMFPEAEA
jgi:FAD/FMN-containing dehydrogenase